MFEVTQHTAKMASFNPRAEKHGDENKPAGDIKFELTAHSSVLNEFHPGYRKFLYRKPGVGEQPGLPFADDDDLTALAQPNLKPLKLDEKFPGYVLEICAGLESSEPLILSDVELSNFTFEPMNGGSVAITFSVTCHPDADASGALCQAIQNVVDITLTKPSN